MPKKLLILFFTVISFQLSAQETIFELMERTDLRLDEIEVLAKKYFDRVGTERGSGNKQYQRWLYERKFHIDNQGYFINPDIENNIYKSARPGLQRTGVLNRVNYSWTELGPNTWTYTSGWNPGVGRITSVAVHPSNENIIYVSSPGGGIWKSANAGTNWTPLVDFNSSAWMNVFHITIDPSNQNTIYASPTSGSVIKSTNAGTTWAATGSGPSGAKKVLIHPSNSNIIFATSSGGIYRSADAGASWTRVHTETKEDIEFKPGDPNIMYASGSSGTSCVWRSADMGLTWTAIGSGNGITNTGRTLLGVSPANPDVVYAVQASGSVFGRMYKSTDAGNNYVTTVIGSAASGTNYFGYETNGAGTTGQATYDMAICVNPVNADEVYIAGIIVWRSLNGGSSFTAQTAWSYPNGTGYNHADVHALEWVNTNIYSGSDGGVYKRVNASGSWIDLTAGLGIKQIYRIAVSKTNGEVMTLGAQDNGSSFRRSGGNWVDWLGADGMDNIISPTNADIAYGTSQYGSMYKTTNAGASRTNLPKPPGGNWVTPIVMHPSNHNIVYGGWKGVYRSDNGGSNWVLISDTSVNKNNYTNVAVSPSDVNYIYASIGSTLYRTSDGGANWTSITAPASINSIFVHPSIPQKIYLACNSSSIRVLVSIDMGSTFTDLSAGLPSLVARSVVVDDNAEESMYVGMNIGVYYRDNIETAWVEHATGLPLVAINEVEIHKASGKLRVATYGRGVWSTDLYAIPTSCGTPASVTSSAITTSSATINWGAVVNATSYDLQYKVSSSSTFTLISGLTGTSHNLTGLTESTSYDYQVRANCAGGNGSFSTLQSFTTLSSCSAPANASAGSITSSGATISWASVANATSYDLQYKQSSAATFTTVAGIAGTSHVLSGLNASTSYDYQVKANCNAGTSNFTTLQSFTTSAPPVCAAPTNVVANPVTGTTATISWSLVPASSYYYIKYKKTNAKNWITTPSTTATSYQLTGLSNKTNYVAQVWVVCANGSSYYTQISFRTANNGPDAAPGAYMTDEFTIISSFRLAPNPASNKINVQIPVSVSVEGAAIQVVDMYGRILKTVSVNSNNMQVDISSLAKGIYRLKYSTGAKTYLLPFVKN
jgi:hypothetical protein